MGQALLTNQRFIPFLNLFIPQVAGINETQKTKTNEKQCTKSHTHVHK